MFMISDHMFLTVVVVLVFCLVLLAIILSSCSLLSMTFNHCFMVFSSVCAVFLMVLSHLIVQIRWADSDIRIQSRRDAPDSGRLVPAVCVLSSFGGLGREIVPQPRIRPM